jgi:hypothetical protein
MSAEKKVPNPYGKLGGPEHKAKVKEVEGEVQKRGLIARLEVMIQLFSGKKRYIDVGGFDPEELEEPVELHQIGRQTKSGNPVKRERDVIEDLKKNNTITPEFHAYNKEGSDEK